ncbi:hemolysin family protein [Corynebacterium epidermidicanis]|uniref:CBS domain-containing protein n=1 Tax=Corynebacterium epidermidicanis TaxID=1050174 RepID=A0A0G3GW46_9CORY|nr:hemolysin family protein [Corynebacterium epidermidicanis]AKK03092.1 CBS domain-containing protein [Corynebacterium epidermidicanis]
MEILMSILSLLGFIALTAGTGCFVAIEFALSGIERSTVEQHVTTKNDALARAVQRDYNNLSFVLSGAQLGITITTLATGFLAEPILSQYLTPLLQLCGLSASASQPTALVLAMLIATLLSMVYGELVPKNIAITLPIQTARGVTRPVHIFNLVFKWFIVGLNSAANAVLRKFGIEPVDELASARSPQELQSLVRTSAEHGELDKSTAVLLGNSLEFGESTAEEFMTPRAKIEALSVDDTVLDLLELARETGHSRFPVIDGDLDNTIGVVHVKNAFAVDPAQRSTVTLRTLARPVPVIPDSLDGDAVLNAVRSAGSQVVLVADEYGGTAGLVTIEDVVEEILGEVYDEYDDDADREFVRNGAAWDIDGLARVDDLPETTGYYPPEGPYETLGGLIMTTLGRIPVEGDLVLLPDPENDFSGEFESGIRGRWTALITSMEGRRVDRVVLQPVSNEEATEMMK